MTPDPTPPRWTVDAVPAGYARPVERLDVRPRPGAVPLIWLEPAVRPRHDHYVGLTTALVLARPVWVQLVEGDLNVEAATWVYETVARDVAPQHATTLVDALRAHLARPIDDHDEEHRP